MLSAELGAILEEARELGFLGPGPVDRQYEHARGLAGIVGAFAGSFLDLGSGSGLPGLVLADEWPESRGTLLDAGRRRCQFLQAAVGTLGLGARVAVVCGRAERLAHTRGLRAGFDLVVARSFAPPAATAECAVGFLRVGGALVVSEPPDPESSGARWDPEGMAMLGFGPTSYRRSGNSGAIRAELISAPADRWPRRDGVPTKRPLW
jgi:16S rRNA (guanine527-N7)-methyltransferase